MTLLHLALFACVVHEVQYPDDTADTDPVDPDADGDGVPASTDCDDADATVADPATWYGDGDGDGYGSPLSVDACDAPAGFVATEGDCDDGDSATHPGAEEPCTEDVDRNCDGSSGYADIDADGTPACEDCDDGDATAFPGATEVCDGADDDCDGATDEDVGTAWYTDADADGYGTTPSVVACDAPVGAVSADGDCDDADPAINPGAIEVCDGRDDDCDTLVDDADDSLSGAATWYVDYDGDGYGSATLTANSCDAPALYVANADDCEDLDAAINPSAAEVCDAGDTDEDCDGLADDADPSATGQTTRYVDTDGDGYGSATTGTACDFGAGYAENADDCDDTSAGVSPAGTETCDDVDDDCDGNVDEGLGSTFYADTDGDGYGDAAVSTVACSAPASYVSDADDCDDTAAAAHPGAPEVCADGLDNDCDGDAADCQLESTYDASSYDYRITGGARQDYLGTVAIGDFDGDGGDDLAGGLFGYNSPYQGAAAVWYGPVVTSGTAEATSDALFTGAAPFDTAGASVTAGDHDGDGADELIVGADGVSSNAGAAYIVYGGTVWSGSTGLATASDTATITGESASDDLGISVASGGDLDGDGTEEIVFGNDQVDNAGNSAGAAYVLYGSATRRSGSASVTTAEATLYGAASADYFGSGIALVDDMDGDGLDELLVGALGTDVGGSMTGSAYLFLGDTAGLSGTMSSATADLTFNGTAAGDFTGYDVFNLTDLDGDGYGDAGVYAEGYRGGIGSNAGGLFVLSGGSTLSPTATATLYGSTTFQYFGQDATSVGDQDGDGTNDLFVGAPMRDSGSGRGYLFYGPVVGTISSAAADVTFFERMSAGNDVYFGRNVPHQPGDVTGDGIPDIVVGGYGDDTYDTDAGSIWVWAGLGGQ